MDVDDVRLRVEVVVPDIFEQHGAGHHLAGIFHQIFEQAEFARLQRNFLAAAAHLVGEPVEFEITDAIDDILFRRALAAAKHLDTRQQFAEGIGLRQVIVATGTKTGHPIIDLAKRGEDEHRRMDALAAQLADDGETVAARQHAVDDDDVIGIFRSHEQTALAVAGVVGDNARLAKGFREVDRGFEIIFDDENLHAADITHRLRFGKAQSIWLRSGAHRDHPSKSEQSSRAEFPPHGSRFAGISPGR
ncbi:transcriptional regulator [Rhizobium etli CNPAF512]|nr:transcriptional regulator [Rhizobium etli CNPAF512]